MGVRPPFRERWLWARTELAEARRRYAKALELILELEQLRPLSLERQALKAMLLLRNGRPNEAHDLLLSVRESSKDRDDPDGQYIRRYAQSWLASIRMHPWDARREDREAARIECSPRLRRLLWLPSGDEPHPLNAEFDAWIKANPPGDADLRKRRL